MRECPNGKLREKLGPLKPCPFCGAAPREPSTLGGDDERSGYNFRVHIECSGCGAQIIRDSYKNKEGWVDDKGRAKAAAIEAWNRRAITPAAPAQEPA